MNKKILIIITSIIVLILIIFGFCFIKNIIKNERNNNKNYQEIESKNSKFKFIYNYNEIITEEWLNALNSELKDYGVTSTNREVLNKRTEQELGNITGKLSVRPVDFYDVIEIKDEFYSLEAKNNTFLIPEHLKVIDDNISNVSSELNFYVIGSNLRPYEIRLNVAKNPDDVELVNNEWKIVSKINDGMLNCDAYYPVNTSYCLHLTFPDAYLEETINSLSENTREYFKDQRPYSKSDLEELVDKTVKVFSLNKLNDTKIDKSSFNIKLNDIQLDNNTIVHMNGVKIISWQSGSKNVAKIYQDDTGITAYNSSNEWVYVKEYSPDKQIDELFSYLNLSTKEYNYNGRNILIVYFNNEAEIYKGMYKGIMFKVGDYWYEVSVANPIEPTTDVNTWINNMCDGVVTFK